MKAQKIKGLALAVVCLLAVGSVTAQEEQKKERPTLEEMVTKLDKNEDKKLSKEELKGSRMEKRFTENWAAIDTDKDANLSLEEIKAYQKKNKGKGKGGKKEKK